MKAVKMAEEIKSDEVGIPKVVQKRSISPDSIPGISIVKKTQSKVKESEMEIERRKSDERFKELRMNDVLVYLLNSTNQIVKTSSKMCGDDEYLFTISDNGLRVWKGGISVFEDGSKDILFNRPHIAIDFSDELWTLVTDIHSFEIKPILRILDAVNALQKYIDEVNEAE